MDDLNQCIKSELDSGVLPWVLERSVVILDRKAFSDRFAMCVTKKSANRYIKATVNHQIRESLLLTWNYELGCSMVYLACTKTQLIISNQQKFISDLIINPVGLIMNQQLKNPHDFCRQQQKGRFIRHSSPNNAMKKMLKQLRSDLGRCMLILANLVTW